ncbi:MAG TPA: hypothetical protein VFG63_07045 [Nocardioidaceae bacterium]|nr:hypothetical protein [Nocardioidaceae bacterium]
MPSPSTPTPATVFTRRAAVAGFAAGAGGLWAGCTAGDKHAPTGRAGRDTSAPPERDPDIAVAAEALAGEQKVLDAVTASTARHHDLASVLSPVAQAHRAHVRLLAEATPPEASVSPSPDSAVSDVPSGAPTPFRVPGRADAALRRIAALEQHLSTENKQHAFAAQSGAFARLLASMAASAAQHAVVLDGAAAPGRGSR